MVFIYTGGTSLGSLQVKNPTDSHITIYVTYRKTVVMRSLQPIPSMFLKAAHLAPRFERVQSNKVFLDYLFINRKLQSYPLQLYFTSAWRVIDYILGEVGIEYVCLFFVMPPPIPIEPLFLFSLLLHTHLKNFLKIAFRFFC